MIISNMRFDSYEWKHNPLTVEVSFTRKMSRQNMPSFGGVVFPTGCDLRVVSGKGEFAGSDCLKRFEELSSLFEKGRKGLLTLPFTNPFYAYFTDLSLKGEATPDLITYTFEFTEAQSKALSRIQREYMPKKGETLFDVAYDFSVPLEELVRLNPQIKRPDELKIGEAVRLC